jgi:uncharacterized membrane protein
MSAHAPVKGRPDEGAHDPPTHESARRSYRQARSVEELTAENVDAILRLEREAHRHRSKLDEVADRVSRFGSSTGFLVVHVVWFSFWIAFNTLVGKQAFDPYPFTFLTLVVSLEAIFLSSFILISQRHEARISERRNQLDLQINLLTEQENTKQLQLLQRIAAALGVEDHDDPSLRVLEEATRPEKLAEQIDRASRKVRGDDADD